MILRCQSCDYSHLSSTPLKSRSSNCPHAHLSPSPLSPPIFSAHHPTGCCRPGNPTSSSLVSTPGVNLPQLSPIETDGRGAGEGSKVNSNTCKRLFSLSPHPQVSKVRPNFITRIFLLQRNQNFIARRFLLQNFITRGFLTAAEPKLSAQYFSYCHSL